MRYFVYVLASRSKTLYTGVTNNLERRVFEHKTKAIPGFTSRYNVDRVVSFEDCERIDDAIAREKQIKDWIRAKKVALIDADNPEWLDLAEDWFGTRSHLGPQRCPPTPSS